MGALLKAQDKDAWGPDLPDWIEALAKACDATSQNRVAKQLERSAPLVSQVLGKKYPGDMALVEDLVRGVFMKETISCPGFGYEIGKQKCRKWRARAGTYLSVNPRYAHMFRACNACPIHLEEKDTPDDDTVMSAPDAA